MIYETLRDSLVAEVEYPPELKDLIGQMEPWREFSALPDDLKKCFEYPRHQRDIDPGYKARSSSAGFDDKEFFHYILANQILIGRYDLGDLVRENPFLSSFFDYARRVHEASTELAMDVAESLIEEVPEIESTLVAGLRATTLRFLHYYPQNQTDQVLAAQHFDRSGFTLHLFESHPGLQVLNFDGEWQDMDVEEGKALVLVGYQLEGMSKGRLQNTWHRVRRVDDSNGPIEHRYSAVLFTSLVNGPSYTGRAQDEVPEYFRRNWG
jgi:hypothetical protein